MRRLTQSNQFVLLPFHLSHTLDFDACNAVTEMHDRMIAADARRTKATLRLAIRRSRAAELLWSEPQV